MSRLIDADKLIRAIWDKYNSRYNNASVYEDYETEFANNLLTEVQALIDNQPTAYDLDKVVMELEEKYDSIPVQYECNYESGLEDGYLEAIEIVKRGGVYE